MMITHYQGGAMKTLIVCESHHHGNTMKVALRMADALSADLSSAADVADVSGYDLIGFGSGIYFNKHHEEILNLVKRLDLSGKRVFVFSTSGMGFRLLNRGLLKMLKEKGAVPVGSFACRGYDTFGPLKTIGGIARRHPNENDLKKAEAFARGLVDQS